MALARALVAALDVPVLVNDRPDVALAAGAAGVHLGPDDCRWRWPARIAPPGFVIGASVGSEAEAAAAAEADYWGIGPWRVTTTKADAGPALGAEGFARLVRLAGGRPCIAIGGVRPEDVPAGARGGRRGRGGGVGDPGGRSSRRAAARRVCGRALRHWAPRIG